jgi:hypothetical protein
VRKASKIRRTSFLIVILTFEMFALGNSSVAFSQQGDCSSSQTSTKATDGPHCEKSSRCFDAGSYTATVADIIESQTPNSRLVRIVVRFENVSGKRIILAYRAHSGFLLDNFKNRYFCCKGAETAVDLSAVGIGTDVDGKVDPQFRLLPNQSDSVSFDLWRSRPPDQSASYYDFDVMIDQIDPDALTVQMHPFVSFRNLRVRDKNPN